MQKTTKSDMGEFFLLKKNLKKGVLFKSLMVVILTFAGRIQKRGYPSRGRYGNNQKYACCAKEYNESICVYLRARMCMYACVKIFHRRSINNVR